MEENLKVDKDYLEAFNLGYELGKELDLKSPMFNDLYSENSHVNVMQAGMKQYRDEIDMEKSKKINKSIESDNDKNIRNDINIKENNSDKGLSF